MALQFEAHKMGGHAHHTSSEQNLPHHAFSSPEPANTPMLKTVQSKQCNKSFQTVAKLSGASFVFESILRIRYWCLEGYIRPL
jgi:hypothetical protein